MRHFSTVALALLLPLIAVPEAAAQIYVDTDATGANDGSSWTDAYTDLQTAIDNASSSSELWIAEGIYTPDSEGDSFTITGNKDGIALYGGFDGTESSRSAREPKTHRTILSGDLNGDDTDPDNDGIVEDADPNQDGTPENLSGPNAHHVLVLDGGGGIGSDVSANVTAATVIDGVVVTAGQTENNGGGVYCDGKGSGNECSPTLRNVVFAGNTARTTGGAVYNDGSVDGTSSPQITSATFTGNTADLGGAIYNAGSSSGTSNPMITNATFAGNAANDGGAIYNDSRNDGTSSPQVTNATMTGNSGNDGGAIFNDGTFDGRSEPHLTNTILWGNSAGDSGDEIFNAEAAPVLSHTIIEGGINGSKVAGSGSNTDGGGNLDQNPLFVDPTTPEGPDGVFGTPDDGLNVADHSPALDAADDAAVPSGITTDITGAARTKDRDGDGTAAVNIGAYEVAAPTRTIYVDSDASGASDGSSWTDAYTDLQAAIDVAERNVEIWVAEGVYTPDSEDDSFTITGTIDGVEVLGGFDGSESSRSAREPNTHRTILSGDLTGDDTDPNGDGIIEDADPNQDGTPENLSGTNATHVLVLDGGTGIGTDVSGNVTRGTVIDGVVVTAGQADFGSTFGIVGGGLYCDGRGSDNACSPTLRNVVFAGNAANHEGGAIYNNGYEGISSPRVIGATFVGNTAGDRGGAICNDAGLEGASSPQVINATFVDNTAVSGGAIFNAGGSEGTSSPQVINATFVDNTADYGGAIFNGGDFGGTSNPQVTNSVLWGNTAEQEGGEIYNAEAASVLSHTIIEGDVNGSKVAGSSNTDDGGNLDQNPQFADASSPAGPDGVFATRDDGLNVADRSAALDAGDGAAVPAGVTTDVTGAARTQDRNGDGTAVVNIGAYEVAAPTRTIIYVDTDANGTNDGSSWTDAYTDLQTAIDDASSLDELWVAEGIYTPDSEGDSFTITGNKDGIALYGGFDGSETSRSAREPKTNRTILSGDLNGDDTDPDGDGIIEDADPNQDGTPENLSGTNATHVLVLDGGDGFGVGADVSANVTAATVIDGVVVTAGQAENNGGGLYCDGYKSGNACSPTLRHVVFSGNAANRGGGLYANGRLGTSSPDITDAVFVGNAARTGGGMFSDGFGGESDVAITNVVFASNSAGQKGGAIHSTAGDGGSGRLSITNVTFTGNAAGTEGGALSSTDSTPQVTNSILWGNTAENGGDEIYSILIAPSSRPEIASSIMEGGVEGAGGSGVSDGGNNLDQAPQFADASNPAGPDGIFRTVDDGTNVTGGSPALDAGDDAAVPSGVTTDLTGASRTKDRDGGGTATVNIGAYEALRQVPVAVTGGGSGGLARTFSPTPGAADQPAGIFRLTPDRDEAGLGPVTLSPDAADATGVDRVALWRSSDDQFSTSDDTELASVDTDPQTALPSTLTFSGISEALPGEARYLFVTVTLTDQADGSATFALAGENDLSLQGGTIDAVNGTSQSSFADLALSSGATPLPVEMAAFDGRATEDGVRLTWQTASEQNNAGFRVLRKGEGANGREGDWREVGFVEGSGTTSEPQRYRFTDEDLPYAADSVRYRLKQEDTDGSTHLTDPVTVARGGPDGLELLGTAPNPARRRATVRYGVPESIDGTVRMRLYDVMGRRVRSVQTSGEPGRHKQAVDVDGLSSGVYFVRLRAGQQVKTRKLTVVK